jgi:hypothetical protein
VCRGLAFRQRRVDCDEGCLEVNLVDGPAAQRRSPGDGVAGRCGGAREIPLGPITPY